MTGGLNLYDEMNKGLATSFFSYKSCEGGFTWLTDDCSNDSISVSNQTCSVVPFIQREPIRQAVQNYWNNNGITFLNMLAEASRCPNNCSNQGICDEKSGLCQCDFGFTGCDCNSGFDDFEF